MDEGDEPTGDEPDAPTTADSSTPPAEPPAPTFVYVVPPPEPVVEPEPYCALNPTVPECLPSPETSGPGRG